MQSGRHRLQLPPHRCPPQQRRRRRDRPGWGRKKPASAPTSCLNVLPTTRRHPLPRPGELSLLGPEARRVHAGPELQGLRYYVQVRINIKRCKPQTLSMRGLGNSQLIHALFGKSYVGFGMPLLCVDARRVRDKQPMQTAPQAATSSWRELKTQKVPYCLCFHRLASGIAICACNLPNMSSQISRLAAKHDVRCTRLRCGSKDV